MEEEYIRIKVGGIIQIAKSEIGHLPVKRVREIAIERFNYSLDSIIQDVYQDIEEELNKED